eukprot:Opistho-2@885
MAAESVPFSSKHANKEAERFEREQETAFLKAIRPTEKAPKEKHVRLLVVTTHQQQNGNNFWKQVQTHDLSHNHVQLFKAFVCMHRILQDGHPSVVAEYSAHVGALDQFERAQRQDFTNFTQAITAQVRFLIAKLGFHRTHPTFPGNMTLPVEEFKAHLANMEGFEASAVLVKDLLALQKDAVHYHQVLLKSIASDALERHKKKADAKLSALVPLAQEMLGIHSMMTTLLHEIRSSSYDRFLPLWEHHVALFQEVKPLLQHDKDNAFTGPLLDFVMPFDVVSEAHQQPTTPIPTTSEKPADSLNLQPIPVNISAHHHQKSGATGSTSTSNIPPDVQRELEALRARVVELELQHVEDVHTIAAMKAQLAGK